MTRQPITKTLAARMAALLTTACLITAAHSARASGNLLSNGDFELPGDNSPATDWTQWSWGDGFANTEMADWGSGSWHITAGAFGGGGGGFYQIVAGTAGIDYTLSVDSGADDWWLPTGRMEMFFLDSSSGVINSATRLTLDPEEYGTNSFDVPHPWSNYTLVATAPAGTKFIKVEFSCNESITTPGYASGSVGFDNASLTAPIDPPVIANVYPNGLLMPTNTLSFTASSAVAINDSDIEVMLNGEDVSSSLAFAGSGTTSVSVSYSGLESNTVYTAVINVTDTAGLSSLKNVNFDTYDPIFTWEAEDYNYGGGSYINNPVPSDAYNPGVSYFGVIGIDGVDFHDYSGDADGAVFQYRAGDGMATATVADGARQKFLDAGASDYNVGWFRSFTFESNVGISSYDPGEWVNYTRDFPPGTYYVYGRLAREGGGTGTLPLSRVISDPTLYDQTTEPLGTFRFPEQSWFDYNYAPLTDEFGNLVEVTLSGKETLRASSVQEVNLNFFMLMPVDNEQPRITDVYPDGRTLLQGTNALTFTASSANHSIAQSNVIVTLNGADVSGGLTFNGSSSSWNVSAPLQRGVTNYTAVISITDDVGNAHSLTLYFDTFAPDSFVVEAEDFDFDGGDFIDHPVVTSEPATNSYFGRVGREDVDSFFVDHPPQDAPFRYRGEADAASTDLCTDTPMRRHLEAQLTNQLAFNYNIAYWTPNAWLNFTRTYPTGDFNVYGRLAGGSGAVYSVSLHEVNGTTNHLGTFAGVGRGYNLFDWIPLVNTNTSQLVEVTLGGESTLRLTTVVGDVNPNNFVLVPAVTVAEELQWSYFNGVLTLDWDNPAFHLQVQTNAPGSGITPDWSDYPGGDTGPIDVPLNPAQGSLFFRLSND